MAIHATPPLCPASCGSAGAREITGCRFSLYPLTDRFVDIILEAVSSVDTTKVWHHTDHLSTVYRGKRIHVLDAVKACFIRVWQPDVHMCMEATISRGCPGDVEADAYLAEDDGLLNEPGIKDRHFTASCKISLYPMGREDYMLHIARIVELAREYGVYAGPGHYVTMLEGDVQALFTYLDAATLYCDQNLDHYILQTTVSVNSPTDRERK